MGGELNGLVAILQQGKTLAEHAAQVGTVHLIKNENVGQSRFPRLLIEGIDQPEQIAGPVFCRTVGRNVKATDKVLVAVGRVQLQAVDVGFERVINGGLRLKITSGTHGDQGR
jgi:hypothetical protein